MTGNDPDDNTTSFALEQPLRILSLGKTDSWFVSFFPWSTNKLKPDRRCVARCCLRSQHKACSRRLYTLLCLCFVFKINLFSQACFEFRNDDETLDFCLSLLATDASMWSNSDGNVREKALQILKFTLNLNSHFLISWLILTHSAFKGLF